MKRILYLILSLSVLAVIFSAFVFTREDKRLKFSEEISKLTFNDDEATIAEESVIFPGRKVYRTEVDKLDYFHIRSVVGKSGDFHGLLLVPRPHEEGESIILKTPLKEKHKGHIKVLLNNKLSETLFEVSTEFIN
ncbi:MAG: hypothetical protein HRT88_16590 [Lentisphaeraceae bacterium]|nr:hypothetical protein [Lentisphaeraceae bacterium]